VPSRVEIDYVSLFGGEVTYPSARELVGGWEAVLPGFTMTHHMIGPPLIVVRGLHASAEAQVVGRHVIDDETIAGGGEWIVGGRYDLRLEKHGERWIIAALKLTATWQEGNRALMQAAAKRLKPA
jgi:hypothetical protein